MLIVDGHVHIYDRFDLNRFFAAAFTNFAAAAEALGAETYSPVIFLADWPGQSWFENLKGLCEGRAAQGRENSPDIFRVERTEEPVSLTVRRRGGTPIIVIAARKIITAENLEVMALFSAESFVPGKPLTETVQCLRDKGAITVLSWAVGKWLGKRGRDVDALLEVSGGDVFLADNANRPWFWPRPRQFAEAGRSGAKILAGSDPLDLVSETDRTGLFGFVLPGDLDTNFPARQLKDYLCDDTVSIISYGSLETVFRFVRNQCLLFFAKRRRRSNGKGSGI
ncbi:MAG: hypothetical protein ACOC1Q_01950 [Desulfosalsimonas sp.]